MTWIFSSSAPLIEGLLLLGCQVIAAAPKVTHPHPQIHCQRMRMFSLPGWEWGVWSPLKRKSSSAWYKKKEECVFHVSWKNVQQLPQIKAKRKDSRCAECRNQSAAETKVQEQVYHQPLVKLPDPLVPGQPLSNRKLPFSGVVREWVVWLDSTSC